MNLQLVLQTEPPSKKNRYRMGQHRFYLDQKVKTWMDDCYSEIKGQLPRGYAPVSSNLALRATFHVKRSKDTDNLLNSLFDLLQHAKVIKNDSQIVEVHAFRVKAKDEPYIQITLQTEGDSD